MQTAIDLLLFVVAPYVAVIVCAIGTFERCRNHNFSVTSQSSQFFENRQHFWGYMPFHLGILAVLAAHLTWFLVPGTVLRWNMQPLRLYVFEIAVLGCGLLALLGYLAIGWRRAANAKLRLVTSTWDWLVYALLLAQIGLGIVVALRHSWGSSWFAAVVAPYLWSLLRLNPDAGGVAALPLLAQAHIVAAYVLVAVFPFSRLVHIITVPNPYLWRPPQVVRWIHRSAEAAEGRR